MLELCVDLRGRVEDVGVARHFVARTLREWHLSHWVEDASLITSELVANAVVHSRTSLRVTVRVEAGDAVWIEVDDGTSRLPLPVNAPPDATSGRGLTIVAAVATTWGTRSRGTAKTVWAQLGSTVTDEPDGVGARTAAG